MPAQSIVRIIRQLQTLTEGDDQLSPLVEELAKALNIDRPRKQNTLKTKTQLKSKTKIKNRSPKREEEYVGYREDRTEFLIENPVCQVRDCDNLSCDIHHMKKRNGKRLKDRKFWMAVCRGCHTLIGENPQWAYEQGYLFKVNTERIVLGTPSDQTFDGPSEIPDLQACRPG